MHREESTKEEITRKVKHPAAAVSSQGEAYQQVEEQQVRHQMVHPGTQFLVAHHFCWAFFCVRALTEGTQTLFTWWRSIPGPKPTLVIWAYFHLKENLLHTLIYKFNDKYRVDWLKELWGTEHLEAKSPCGNCGIWAKKCEDVGLFEEWIKFFCWRKKLEGVGSQESAAWLLGAQRCWTPPSYPLSPPPPPPFPSSPPPLETWAGGRKAQVRVGVQRSNILICPVLQQNSLKGDSHSALQLVYFWEQLVFKKCKTFHYKI